MKRLICGLWGTALTATPLVAPLLVAPLLFPQRAHAQLSDNICDGDFVFSQNIPTELDRLLVSGGVFTLGDNQNVTDGGGAVAVNSIGYSLARQGFLGIRNRNAVRNGGGGATLNEIFVISPTGAATSLGAPVLPNSALGAANNATANYVAGDIDASSGFYYIYSQNTGDLVVLDVSGAAATVVATTVLQLPGGGGNPQLADIAYNPVDGQFYGHENNIDRIISFPAITATTPTVTVTDVTAGRTAGGPVGAAFIDGFGSLFIYSNTDGQISQIDNVAATPGTLTTLAATTPGLTQNDGATCPAAVRMEKTVSPSPASPGDIVTYTYVIENPNPQQFTADATGFVDDTFSNLAGAANGDGAPGAPFNGSTRTFIPGTATISTTSPGGTASAPVAIGETLTNANRAVAITGFTIPGGSNAGGIVTPGSVTITVDVQIPPEVDPGSTIFNQATVQGQLDGITGTVGATSDAPATPVFPDETPLPVDVSPNIFKRITGINGVPQDSFEDDPNDSSDADVNANFPAFPLLGTITADNLASGSQVTYTVYVYNNNQGTAFNNLNICDKIVTPTTFTAGATVGADIVLSQTGAASQPLTAAADGDSGTLVPSTDPLCAATPPATGSVESVLVNIPTLANNEAAAFTFTVTLP